MGLLRWFTANRANTAGPSHPDLRPLELPCLPAEAAGLIAGAVGGMPRWAVVDTDPGTGTVRLTRRTRLFRFVDDVTVRLELDGADRTKVQAESHSRVGKGDLGQNRRNILELWRAVSRATRDRERSGR